MRFKGRVRFEDVATGDLDVAIEVDGTHVRLLSGEESLGSWCLADVVARRLLANEFELNLDEETVVFLAEDQVNFAYGAVQDMAEGWARYHAMNVLRRGRAVASARRKNEPSRLAEVRRAFVANADVLWEESVDEDEDDTAQSRLTRRTGGLLSQHDPEPERKRTPQPSSSFRTKLETAANARSAEEHSEPALPETVVVPDQTEPVAEPKPIVDRPTPESEPVSEPEPEPASEPDPDTPSIPERPNLGSVTPGRMPRLDAFPRLGTTPETNGRPNELPDEEHIDVSPDEVTSRPDFPRHSRLAEEDLGSSATHIPPAPDAEGQLSDLASVGSYEDGHHPAETSGLRASMKSIFGRSRAVHEHTFVESTTAVGLTRNVCIDCGHVSIGVRD